MTRRDIRAAKAPNIDPLRSPANAALVPRMRGNEPESPARFAPPA